MGTSLAESPGLDRIIGQEGAISLLRKVLSSGRVPHAFLFHGPEGVGKWTTVLAFARALLCSDLKALETVAPCGRCHSCRMIVAGSHPDLYRIGLYPKKLFPSQPKPREMIPPLPLDHPDGGKEILTQIRIHQIRWLNHQASHAPVEADWRLFAIDPADRLNPQAQNALLKTLEEPESRALIVLITSRPHVILPTLRSRCISVGFGPVDPGRLAPFLEENGIPSTETVTRAALASGRPGAALTLDLAATRARRAGLLDDILALTNSPTALANLPEMTARILGNGEKELQDGLDLLLGLFRDLSRLGAGMGAQDLLHGDVATDLMNLERRMLPGHAAVMVEQIDHLRAGLRFNVNKTLLAETILTLHSLKTTSRSS